MKNVFTISAMKSRYDAEWVLIENPETDENLAVKKGRVIFHSKNRDEVYRKARELKLDHSAILHFGRLPKDVAVIL